MDIKEQIITSYIENELEFDLPKLSLKNSKFSIFGSGTVRLTRKGALKVKIYSKSRSPFTLTHFINEHNKSLSDAGKLIKDDDFYELKGYNNIGKKFRCKKVLIDTSDENIIQGRLLNSFEVIYPNYRNIRYSNLEIIVNSNVNIPEFDSQFLEQRFPIGSYINKQSRNSFFVEYDDTKILMFNKDKHCVINIKSEKNEIDTKYIDNIMNSLEFMTGKIHRWNIAKMYDKDNNYKFLYHSNNSIRKGTSLSKSPFDYGYHLSKTENVKNLFIEYFKFINSDRRNVLKKIISRNLISSYSYLHVFGLSLSANIEELLNTYFAKYSKSDLKSPDIEKAIAIVSQNNINESIKNRLVGLLQSIDKNVNVNDIFKGLKKNKTINKHEIEDWKKLRNASAHGAVTNNFETQKHLDLIYKNLVLYHKIIFLIIGYNGIYSNYGKYGHPCEEFKLLL